MLFCKRMKWVRDPNFQIIFLIYENKQQQKLYGTPAHILYGLPCALCCCCCCRLYLMLLIAPKYVSPSLLCASLFPRCAHSRCILSLPLIWMPFLSYLVSNLIVQYLTLRQSRSKDVKANIHDIFQYRLQNIASRAHLIASKFTMCVMHIFASI